MPSRAEGRKELITGLAVGAFTAVYLVKTLDLPRSGATASDIGPKIYPLVVCALLAASTLALVGQGARRSRRARGEPGPPAAPAAAREPSHWWRLAGMIAATAVYLNVLEPLGFLIATALYLAAALYAADGLGRYRGARLVLAPLGFGVATSIGIYVLFDALLGVPLPTGLFGWSF